ncbi:MAG: hypothetical protein ACI9FN_003497 [Saprospiraceae bacterium]|jgi:hypothetical protein
MKYWQEGIFSWGHFISISLLLIGVYFFLKLIIRVGLNVGILGKTQERVVSLLKQFLFVFEPLSLVILLSLFVMISPLFHGTILGLILLSNIAQIRNYFMGRMLMLNETITVGSPIKSGSLKGTVVQMDRLGLRIRTLEGVHFLNYQYLIEVGYLISNLDQIGGNYIISIVDERKESKKELQVELYHLLRSSPFIEPERKIRIDVKGAENIANVSLAIRNKDHMTDLIEHLKERGFLARIIND